LISIHRELSKIKNRKASYLEEEIARLILVSLPFKIRMKDDGIPDDSVEELKDKYESNQRVAIKMSSELLRYGREILESKNIKEVFISRIADKDKDLQFFALYGLETYYAHESAEELTKEEEEKLEEIINSTESRETASTCCQILINAEKINEFGAKIQISYNYFSKGNKSIKKEACCKQCIYFHHPYSGCRK